jgi:hypothetical protein
VVDDSTATATSTSSSSMGVYDQLRFFHNAGDSVQGQYARRETTGETGGLDIHADYNNDGHPDLRIAARWLDEQGRRFPNHSCATAATAPSTVTRAGI